MGEFVGDRCLCASFGRVHQTAGQDPANDLLVSGDSLRAQRKLAEALIAYKSAFDVVSNVVRARGSVSVASTFSSGTRILGAIFESTVDEGSSTSEVEREVPHEPERMNQVAGIVEPAAGNHACTPVTDQEPLGRLTPQAPEGLVASAVNQLTLFHMRESVSASPGEPDSHLVPSSGDEATYEHAEQRARARYDDQLPSEQQAENRRHTWPPRSMNSTSLPMIPGQLQHFQSSDSGTSRTSMAVNHPNPPAEHHDQPPPERMTSVVLPSDFVFPENLGTLLEEMKTLRTFSRRGSLEKPEEHGSTDIGTADLTSSRSTASTNDASPGLVTNEPPGVVGSHTEEYCFLLRRAIISIRVAEVLEEMGELTEACKWNNDADWLLTKAKCGAPLGLSNTRFHLASINNAAHILYRLRRYRDASALFRRALEVCDTAEMQLARVTIYCSLARTFEHMRLPSLVHEQYDAAARVCGQSAAKEMLKKHIDVLYLKAKYYLKSKNTNEAIQTYADVQTLLLQLTGGVSCLELCDSYAQTGALRALMNSHTLAVQDFGKALAGLKETQPPNQYNRNKMVRNMIRSIRRSASCMWRDVRPDRDRARCKDFLAFIIPAIQVLREHDVSPPTTTANVLSWAALCHIYDEKFENAKNACNEAVRALELCGCSPVRPDLDYGRAYAMLGTVSLAENQLSQEAMDFLTRAMMIFTRLEALEEMASTSNTLERTVAGLEARVRAYTELEAKSSAEKPSTPTASRRQERQRHVATPQKVQDKRMSNRPRSAPSRESMGVNGPSSRASGVFSLWLDQDASETDTKEKLFLGQALLNHSLGNALQAHNSHKQALTHMEQAMEYAVLSVGPADPIAKMVKATLKNMRHKKTRASLKKRIKDAIGDVIGRPHVPEQAENLSTDLSRVL